MKYDGWRTYEWQRMKYADGRRKYEGQRMKYAVRSMYSRTLVLPAVL